jgi:sortase (surface protein transpeptidase)
VRIPSIAVDAELIGVGLKGNGEMVVPETVAGWYDLGPKPGQAGPAVLVAHRSWNRRPGVFNRLNEIAPDDLIEVLYDSGRIERFEVERSEVHDKSRLPVKSIWNATERPVLRLITCGGEFDQKTRHYLSNIIVFASPAGS